MTCPRDTLSHGRAPVGVAPARRPRIGFLGLGWIGRLRLRSLMAGDVAEIVALADPDEDACLSAASHSPEAQTGMELDELLAHDLDGVVIATPSALHCEQATRALAAGVAVFCEKPLGRGLTETRSVLDAALRADRLLSVDLSYRHIGAARALRDVVRTGVLGDLQLVELVFHNAYGPDKPWFTRRSSAGGGCLIDLGTHLVDLLMWVTGERCLSVESAVLRRRGRPLPPGSEEVEDLALATLSTAAGTQVRLACSWFLPAGRDCAMECSLYGNDGAVALYNVDGSFYDFVAERFDGTRRTSLAGSDGDWGGGAITAWARRLAHDRSFDPAAAAVIPVAATLQRIYEAAR